MKQFGLLCFRSFVELGIYCLDTFVLFFLRLRSNPLSSNEILIIKPDGIGDFILFRNFIGILSDFYEKQNCRLSILVDTASKSLSDVFRPGQNVSFVYLDKAKFRGNLVYRYAYLSGLQAKFYNEVIYFSFSRVFRIGDTLTRFTSGKKKIAVRGDDINRYSFQLISNFFSEFIYSEWIDGNFKINRFEYLMIQELTAKIVGKPVEVLPSLPGSKWNPTELNEIAIFPFASDARRCWPLERYAELINLITSYSSEISVKLLGPPDQKHSGDRLMSLIHSGKKVINQIGLFTLPELISEISRTQFLISNETMSVHIAAATGTPAICITFGNLYGRFYPYPKEFKTKIVYVYPHELQLKLDLGNNDLFKLDSFSINSISVESVFSKFVDHYNEYLPETINHDKRSLLS